MQTSPGDPAKRAKRTGSRFMDFMPRLISAIALALAALWLTYWGLWPFALLVALVAAVLSWEWGSLVGRTQTDLAFFVHAAAVVLAIGLCAMGLASLAILAVAVGAVFVGALQFGASGRMSAFGVLYVGVPAVALMWLRADEPHGFAAILFLFAVVWMTDIGAYGVGRAIGGPKLWPAVSPGKTWSGLIGGVGIGVLAGVICAYFFTGRAAANVAVTALILALVAQAGDLAESALKRGFGVKDTSSLIPGHGGFMDRVDGLVAAAAAAALVAIATDIASPARALLFWS